MDANVIHEYHRHKVSQPSRCLACRGLGGAISEVFQYLPLDSWLVWAYLPVLQYPETLPAFRKSLHGVQAAVYLRQNRRYTLRNKMVC